MKSPTGRYSYRQAVITFPTKRRVGDVFTQPVIEVLRQALNLKQTSQITNSQAVRTNRQAGNMFSTLPDRTDCFCVSGSRIGIHITLDKPPSPVIHLLFHTTKMTATHEEQLIDHLRVFFLVFIEFNFFILHDVFKTQKTAEPPPTSQTNKHEP